MNTDLRRNRSCSVNMSSTHTGTTVEVFWSMPIERRTIARTMPKQLPITAMLRDLWIIARVEQLREEQSRLASISRERMISDDVSILDLDPLDLWIVDEKTLQWRMRYLHEIPRRIRKILKFTRNGKKIIPDVDKDAARRRLIDVLGYASAKDINITANNMVGELRVGFDDDSEQ